MIDDEKFIRGKIPMTKQEVRVLTLAKAQIDSDSIVVDVGAGTGSITIEAARLAKNGKVFAVERNLEAIELIKRNVEKFSVDNVEIICAEAPDGLERLEKILDILYTKLKIGGKIVINAITIQTAATALAYFRANEINYDAFQVQITRLKKIRAYDMNQVLNPVWIVTAEKT